MTWIYEQPNAIVLQMGDIVSNKINKYAYDRLIRFSAGQYSWSCFTFAM